MADKKPPNFLLVQSNPLNTDGPVTLFDQLKPPTTSDILPMVVANYGTPNYLKTDTLFVKVVKVFNKSQPRPGSVPDLEARNNFDTAKPVQHCMAIANDVYGTFVPLPTEFGENITDVKNKNIIKQSVYCYDSIGLLKNGLKPGDKIPVQFVTPTEAKIVGDVVSNEIVTEDGTNNVNGQNDGTTVGDSKQNTSPTGDLQGGNSDSSADCKTSNFLTTFVPKPLVFQNQICGNDRRNGLDNTIVYNTEKCKTGVLPNGQTVSLHSKFFDQVAALITDLQNDPEIIASGYKIAISSGYRTLDGQKYARRLNCPEAVAKGATEQELYYDKWKDLLAKYKCKGPEASPAVRTTSHLTGMAVDILLDFNGKFSQAEEGKPCFKYVRQNCLIYKKINQYAAKNKLINYSKEPWHWSTDGH
jgi:hypothetical protein